MSKVIHQYLDKLIEEHPKLVQPRPEDLEMYLLAKEALLAREAGIIWVCTHDLYLFNSDGNGCGCMLKPNYKMGDLMRLPKGHEPPNRNGHWEILR